MSLGKDKDFKVSRVILSKPLMVSLSAIQSKNVPAHLLYFIIKDHLFSDGNKRLGCLIFLLYLKLQNSLIKLNDNGLVALALQLTEIYPNQKELMIQLIVNILMD